MTRQTWWIEKRYNVPRHVVETPCHDLTFACCGFLHFLQTILSNSVQSFCYLVLSSPNLAGTCLVRGSVTATHVMAADTDAPAMPLCLLCHVVQRNVLLCVVCTDSPLCYFQAAAQTLYKDEVYPDMITNHLRGGRAARGASGSKGPPATVNSAFAAKWDSKFKDTFGAAGEKVARVSAR